MLTQIQSVDESFLILFIRQQNGAVLHKDECLNYRNEYLSSI